jgi:hypothetical protein
VTQKAILIGKTRNYAAFNAALFKRIWYETHNRRMEDLRAALLSVENPFSGHYVFVGEVDANVAVDHGLSYGSKETAGRRRLDFYRQAGLRVKDGQETEISLD